jgi:cyclopropane fatty-acyl-phospholipid synthase-like methyltransferase
LQYKIAQGRLQESKDSLKSKVNLLNGSATNLSKLLGPQDKFDIIIAIDCAYHFDTRWSFIRSSLDYLSNQGQIGLFDVAIQPNALNHPFKRWLFEKICSGGNIPIQNMVNADEYEAKLQEMGYVDIRIERVHVDRVYGGLARFLRRHAANLNDAGLELSFGNYNRLITVAKLLELLCWGKWIEPLIVTAKKPM